VQEDDRFYYHNYSSIKSRCSSTPVLLFLLHVLKKYSHSSNSVMCDLKCELDMAWFHQTFSYKQMYKTNQQFDQDIIGSLCSWNIYTITCIPATYWWSSCAPPPYAEWPCYYRLDGFESFWYKISFPSSFPLTFICCLPFMAALLPALVFQIFRVFLQPKETTHDLPPSMCLTSKLIST